MKIAASYWSKLLLLIACLFVIWSALLISSVNSHYGELREAMIHPHSGSAGAEALRSYLALLAEWRNLNIQVAALGMLVALLLALFQWHFTRRKHIEEALKNSEARAHHVVSSAQDGIITFDEQGKIESFNPAAEQLFGYTMEEVAGCNMDILLPLCRWEFEAYEKNAASASEASVPRPVIGRRKDGSVFPVDLVLSELVIGKKRAFSGILRDITDRRRAEEALKHERNFVAAILDTAGALVIVLDREGRIVRFNRACEQITKYTLNEVRGKEAYDLFLDPEDAATARAQFERVLAGEYPSKAERQWRIRDGSKRLISWANTALVDNEGKVEYVVKIGIDATERKQLEEQLMHSQKMEAVGRLAGGVAHDFNNLLTAITGYSELLIHSLNERDPLRKDVEEIKRAGERAATLTRQLLAFSRKQVMQPKILDLNSVVSDMEKMLRRLIGEDIDLGIVLDKSLGRVKADRGQIEQVILNLAVNARDAMAGGGKLTIETENVVLNELYANRHVGVDIGTYVMLAVTDTGHGMDAATQAHLFEPFFTTKEQGKGTGLGLSTVYGIVTQSGGKIWVHSEVERGTTFKVYLPRISEATEAVRPAVLSRDALAGTETILLVEDEEEVRTLVNRILKRHGYKVLEASHGAEALRHVEASNGRIHLMLTDVVMPTMSGPELARHLRPIRPDMRVLYMSGYTDDAVIHPEGLDPGEAFIQKPFSPDALAVKLREVLESRLEDSRNRAKAL